MARLSRNSPRFVLKSAAILFAAQVLVAPVSVLVNAVIAQKLGPAAFGEWYLAGTFVGFGFLFVEWGQGAALIAQTAQHRKHAGALLGTSFAFRIVGACLCMIVLWITAGFMRPEPAPFRVVLALVTACALFTSLSAACQDVFRGFERVDYTAGSIVAYQLLSACVVVPVLLLGGGLTQMLNAQLACAALGLCVLLLALKSIGVPRLAADRQALSTLLTHGTPFLWLGISLALQPNVDAWFLSKYASLDAIGWHAGAKKLIGVLMTPANAIVSGLYPTLCRLYTERRAAYVRTAQSALCAVSLVIVPIALGCALYPDIGVRILGRVAYRPSEDNLRVLAMFLALVYFSMPLGCCMAAAGMTRDWSIAQLGCVVISAALDPLLIPYFQARHGNGGLGVCVSTVVGEVAMISYALVKVPSGVLDKRIGRRIGLAIAAGLAMTLTAWGLSDVNSFVAAPIALLAYVACLYGSGGIEPDEERVVVDYARRKLRLGT